MDTLTVALAEMTDLAALERDWRELETRADASFFQAWTWVGCLAARRYPDPVLLRGVQGGRLVALALLNRRAFAPLAETLWLGESGVPALDAVFVEHNGVLLDRTAPPATLSRCLASLLHDDIMPSRRCAARRVVASGVSAETRAAWQGAGALIVAERAVAAPRVEFAGLAGPYLDALGANTRYQIRRSDRRYAERGALRVERAETVADAHRYLDGLRRLHQRTWTQRRKAGAFANAEFAAFHRALLDRAMPHGQVDLLRISAGEHEIGYLYNLVHGGRVSAYQSGFDYDDLGPHEKPGLTSHHLAIEHYRRAGFQSYDFLAGEDRYKTSMANAASHLSWLAVLRQNSWTARLEPLRRVARRFLRRVANRAPTLTAW